MLTTTALKMYYLQELKAIYVCCHVHEVCPLKTSTYSIHVQHF